MCVCVCAGGRGVLLRLKVRERPEWVSQWNMAPFKSSVAQGCRV